MANLPFGIEGLGNWAIWKRCLGAQARRRADLGRKTYPDSKPIHGAQHAVEAMQVLLHVVSSRGHCRYFGNHTTMTTAADP